jgi:hypothetical protein
VSYTWTSSIFNPIPDPSLEQITVTPTGNEIYTLTAEDDAGCVGSSTAPVAVKLCTGIERVNADDQRVKVYPNPLQNGQTTVSGMNGLSAVRVYNLLGEVILEARVSEETFLIDLKGRPPGSYAVRITEPGGNTRAFRLINP